MESTEKSDLRTIVAEIVSSYVSRNPVAATDLAGVISTVYRSLNALGRAPEAPPVLAPAVPVRRSVQQDHVVCLECGRRGKTLRRHISLVHGLIPAAYREKWSLPADHPIVAPAYSSERSAFAKQLGLGSRSGERGGRHATQPNSQRLIRPCEALRRPR